MIKQGIDIYSVTSDLQCEAITYAIPYLERLIAEMYLSEKNPLSAGQNLVVAVMVHTGFSRGDSVIINKSSI